MHHEVYEKLIHVIAEAAQPFSGQPEQYANLLEKIGDARFVLLGEATHGTHEFYQTRIAITQELIAKKGFMAIAIEGDWPDAYQIHRYVQGLGNKKECKSVLDTFQRFPIWMWRNTTLPPFLQWLRTHNEKLPPEQKIGFYGLDLYSLYASIQMVISYLSQIDPAAGERARARYACFDNVNLDPQTYGYLTNVGKKQSCAKEVIEQLIEMQYHAFEYVEKDNLASQDEYYYATQNARLIKNAENYYRSMFEGHISSWNIRDNHMAETLMTLIDHLEKHVNKPAKIIVWAHNSHVGDARATEMGDRGEINLGQLVRERCDVSAYLIGFSTYQGFVTAASNWDEPGLRQKINPGLPGTYEDLFHQVKHKNFFLDLHQAQLEHYLHLPRLQRAIGVVYRPDTERESHYFLTRLPYQFDSIIHFDDTTAVEPLNHA